VTPKYLSSSTVRATSVPALAFALALWSCAKAPADVPVLATPRDLVICPTGSTFHASENRCVAVAALGPAKPPAPSATALLSAAPPPNVGSDAKITVTCGFSNGWVAVVPVRAYPKDDEFVMQALIGFSDDPTFWQGQSEYAALETYKAVKCDATAKVLGQDEGDFFVMVGEADTFTRRNRYSRNGMLKKVSLKKGDDVHLDVATKDLVRTFPCISCPWVHFEGMDGTSTEPFVVLARRASREERGTDRKTLRVPVVDGKIHVVVSEREEEVTHLDALSVALDGVALLPILGAHRPQSQFALSADDGIEVVLAKGTRIEQSYLLPKGAPVENGWVTITVSATGHYVPTPSLAPKP
jgi:hypothetical protein